MTTFTASGADILQNVNITTNANSGQDQAGQISVSGGTQLFSDQMIIEFTVDPVDDNGDLTASSGFTQIVVYASEADYLAGTPTYTYTPQNPGQSAGVQDSPDRMGDDYVKFGANVLTSSDPGAPSLGELFVAPGSNVANNDTTTFDHHSDNDYNDDGSIEEGSAEDGNGRFNTASAQQSQPVCFTSGSYVQTARGLVVIDDLRPGDTVSTLDNGEQPILWISKRHIGPADMVMTPGFRPVFIPKGAWGATRNTLVSQQHCILVRPDMLMPAKKLIDVRHSRVRIARGVWQTTYIHIFFERHQVIWVDGVASESLYPGPQAIKGLRSKQRAELQLIFPDLDADLPKALTAEVYGPTARPVERRLRVL